MTAPRAARARPAAVAVALTSLCACAAVQRSSRAHVSETGMPCTEAARVARGALVRLGYTADPIAAPKPGVPVSLVGHKNSGWSAGTPEPGTEYTATVTIACSNQGAEFDAITDDVAAALTFKMDFAAAIEKVAARRITRPELADRPAAGLVIGVEPLRGADAAAEFGADLPAAGITPVRLKIDNRTERTYAFTGARVELVTQEGGHVEPLADPSSPGISAELETVMRRKRIADGALAPAGTLSGFLYFPASTYRRATLVLIDQATDEEEGVSVEF